MGPVAGGTPTRTLLVVLQGSRRVTQLQASPYHPLFTESQRHPNMALVHLVFASLVAASAVVNGQSADYNPLYIGKFEDFSHDGQAPDVFFWADGVIVPYITRNDLQPKIGLERFLPREDIVLLLPKEKPTIHSIERLEVWCRAFGISFGHIDFPDFAKK